MKHVPSKAGLCGMLFAALFSPLWMAQAAPADWYWWSSKTSDARVCAQTSPGEGWTQEKQAYSDARCEKKKL
ncbi:hypothetical protein [Undibacterium curvum]|uniref:hypothetical protein n=1 Tax=Undibacterium curvum TaxID=2762294 RepID=UPI003D133D50